jgi:hypothetical protein
MKELTPEQFIHDCELLIATHTEEELANLSTEGTYLGWCAFQAYRNYPLEDYNPLTFKLIREAYAKEQK